MFEAAPDSVLCTPSDGSMPGSCEPPASMRDSGVVDLTPDVILTDAGGAFAGSSG